MNAKNTAIEQGMKIGLSTRPIATKTPATSATGIASLGRPAASTTTRIARRAHITSKMRCSRCVELCQTAVENTNVSAATRPAASEAPFANLTLSSCVAACHTANVIRRQMRYAETTPHTRERALVRTATEAIAPAPPNSRTNQPQSGNSGNAKASIPVHWTSSRAESPGNT